MQSRLLHGALVLAGLLAVTPAQAQYAHVQIEMVIGSVDGDPAAQAVQLRIGQAGDNALAGMEVVACDATGANPVTICTIPSNVSNGALGARVLLCSNAMLGRLAPSITPDFMLSAPIPTSYLAAGSLYLDMPGDAMGPLWRLSWGGASYSGSGAVETINDADGDCNPAYPSTIDGVVGRGVQFRFDPATPSTTNANDYASGQGADQVWNNAGDKATIIAGTTPVAQGSWGGVKVRYR
jgi:hypothetical protein